MDIADWVLFKVPAHRAYKKPIIFGRVQSRLIQDNDKILGSTPIQSLWVIIKPNNRNNGICSHLKARLRFWLRIRKLVHSILPEEKESDYYQKNL